MVDGVSNNLAFDGGSNQITITEEYATRVEAKEDWDLASSSLASEMSRCSLVNPSGNCFLMEAMTNPFILNNRQPSKVTDII
jgi:hypothetical protein